MKLERQRLFKRVKILSIFLMGNLLSCADNKASLPDVVGGTEVKQPTLPNRSEGSPEPTVLSQPQFRAEVVELPEPNHYKVLLKWDALPDSDRIFVSRKSLESGVQEIEPLEGASGFVEDKSVEAGKEYTYFFRIEESRRTLGQVGVRVPLDKVFGAGHHELNQELRGIGRLFLEKDAELMTRGRDILIEATSLLSNGARILSYPEGTKTLPGIQAKAGGTLRIRSQRGHGVLYIQGRGENGVIGSNGVNGASGTNGGSLDALIQHPPESSDGEECERGFHSAMKSLEEEHARGGIFAATKIQQLKDAYRRTHACIREPVGLDGGRGGNGQNGSKGSSGGDSARIRIKIDTADNFDLRVENSPGQGGNGGLGGKGGPGGQGGVPGKRDGFIVCGEGQSGKEGNAGLEGVTGDKGNPGQRIPFCAFVGGMRMGECDKVPLEEMKF